MVGFEREYWAWCQDSKERYDERLAILCDGRRGSGETHKGAERGTGHSFHGSGS